MQYITDYITDRVYILTNVQSSINLKSFVSTDSTKCYIDALALINAGIQWGIPYIKRRPNDNVRIMLK